MKIIKANLKNFPEIIKAVKDSKVIICPTDTVYGLIADATNEKAVKRLLKIKRRQKGKAIPVFVKDLKMAKRLAYINRAQERFLKKIWPGKVTVILKKKEKIKIFGVSQKTIGLRIPKYKLLNTLLRKLNFPLTGTSANISGRPASTKIKEVLKQFRKQKYQTGRFAPCNRSAIKQPDLVIDAGDLPKSKPSTVLDPTTWPPKVLRA